MVLPCVQCDFFKKFIKLFNTLPCGKRSQTLFGNDIYVQNSWYGIFPVSEIFPDNPFDSVTLYCIPHFFRYGYANSKVVFRSRKYGGNKTVGVYLFSVF